MLGTEVLISLLQTEGGGEGRGGERRERGYWERGGGEEGRGDARLLILGLNSKFN